MTTSKLIACLLNISEGRNRAIIESVASAATLAKEGVSDRFPVPSTVLNIFSDYDYNRSVLTIAAPVEHISRSVVAACTIVCNEIDMRQQHGVHPRLGAVDLIPIYPLSGAVSLQECGEIAKDIATQLSEAVGMSSFLFGSAHPESKSLVQRRKEIGWFGGQSNTEYSSLQYDVGDKPTGKLGLTGVGASYYVTNCNVTIKTQDMKLGRHIARTIRGTSPGGLPGVQSMAFPHNGNIEIACNVACCGYNNDVNSEKPMEGGEPCATEPREWVYTSAQTIEQRVAELAKPETVGVVGTALIGFTPDEAYRLALESLLKGDRKRWKSQHVEFM